LKKYKAKSEERKQLEAEINRFKQEEFQPNKQTNGQVGHKRG
jgi:hypothetical protein